ncbi:MAG: TonB family protein [Wenzhouxiangellaceae bacterium]|nr:TonB family protein [Wenzhouxiangellaceae bacterium]
MKKIELVLPAFRLALGALLVLAHVASASQTSGDQHQPAVSFQIASQALDGNSDAIDALRPCAEVSARCAMVLAAAFRRNRDEEQARHHYTAAIRLGQPLAALAGAEMQWALGQTVEAYAWSYAYLDLFAPDPDALETMNRGIRAVRILQQSKDGLNQQQRIRAGRLAAELANSWRLDGPARGAEPAPRPTTRINPSFPAQLAASRQPGWALVMVQIDSRGRVNDVLALEASHDSLATEMVRALREWVFEPPEPGSGNARWFTQAVEFSLDLSDKALREERQARSGAMDADGWIAFDARNGHIAFDVMVNDTPAVAILDTGADTTTISRGLARRAGIGVGRANGMRMSGVFGEQVIPLSDDFQLSFAGLSVPLQDLPIAPGQGFDLVLGRQLFEFSVVQIDYPNRRIRFLDPAAVDFKGNLKVRKTRTGAPLVQAQVDGKKAWMLFDTGNAGDSLFTRTFVARRDLERFKIDENGTSTGGGAIQSGHLTALRIPKFQLGPFPFQGLRASYIATENQGLDARASGTGSRARSARTEFDGIVGYEVLRNFLVTMDLKRNRIHLHLP